MYLRIKRERFDSLPDIMLAAATKVGAPMLQQTTGHHLTVVYMTGKQLSDYADSLAVAGVQSRSSMGRPETRRLLEELRVCSKLFVVSTTVEIILASNRSPDAFQVVYEEYENLISDYESFNNGCAEFIRGLGYLPPV